MERMRDVGSVDAQCSLGWERPGSDCLDEAAPRGQEAAIPASLEGDARRKVKQISVSWLLNDYVYRMYSFMSEESGQGACSFFDDLCRLGLIREDLIKWDDGFDRLAPVKPKP